MDLCEKVLFCLLNLLKLRVEFQQHLIQELRLVSINLPFEQKNKS